VAKRFTDSSKWGKEWFMELTPKGKLLWSYICDACDHAGVWSENYRLATVQIGIDVTRDDLRELSKNVVSLESGKVFVPGFIEFQYGSLDPKNRAHLSAIRLLEKNGIDPKTLAPSKGLTSPMEGDKDKDKDKDKEKVKEEGGPGETIPAPPLASVDTATAQLQKTLEHFKAGREVVKSEREEIWKMLKSGIALNELVHAISGMRYEPPTNTFDPSKHVSIFRLWDREKRIKLMTLSTQEAQRREAKRQERMGQHAAPKQSATRQEAS
jgi:hypothetical protein